ncbi:MAG: O-antigen ligase family protein [Opitutaceae bacterium]|nr:O-antigen ligase family protein [Opitutaceae bacterium]
MTSEAAMRVGSFRGDHPRLPLHPAEKVLLGILAVHLCFLPWAMGTMHPWSQLVSLGLAAIGFVVALGNRVYTGEHAKGWEYRLIMWPRLLRFPIFWIGLALLGYILAQALNPSWTFVRNATQWWLLRVNDIPWLPTSIDVPFARFNAWRALIIYASAWLVVCSLWIGLTRRRSMQFLLIVLVCNGAALACAGILQHLLGTDRFLGLFPWPPGCSPFASFPYRNHGGAYLALITALAAALATWFFEHGERTMKKSTPASVLAFLAVLLAGVVTFTYSRGATIVLGLFLLLFIIWFLLRRSLRAIGGNAGSAVTLIVAVVFLGLLLNGLRYVDFSSVYARFDPLIQNQTRDESVRARLLAHDAASAMLDSHWRRGVGAGGFRHLFTEYVQRHPEIYAQGRLFWEHAHNDWLETPIELGAGGVLLLLAGAGWWAWWMVRHRGLWHSLAVPIILGLSQTLIHAWFDFPFQCPAILATWCALLTISGRWIEIDSGG